MIAFYLKYSKNETIMKDSDFSIVDKIADIANDKFAKLLERGDLDTIKKVIEEAVIKLPEGYSLDFNVGVSVFDPNRQNNLPILKTGLTCSEGEAYEFSSDSSPQKYLVDGEMCIVPHDHCPHCWGEWDFKFKNPICLDCEYEMGVQVKYLLDDDVCPWCEEGKVSLDNPVCDSCGQEVNTDWVVWG